MIFTHRIVVCMLLLATVVLCAVHPLTVEDLELYVKRIACSKLFVTDVSNQVLCCDSCCLPAVESFFKKHSNLDTISVAIKPTELGIFAGLLQRFNNTYRSLEIHGEYFDHEGLEALARTVRANPNVGLLMFPNRNDADTDADLFEKLYCEKVTLTVLQSSATRRFAYRSPT